VSARSHSHYRRASFVLALVGGLLAAVATASAGQRGLGVEASLDRCGLSAERVVCKIDVGYDRLAGAESYSVGVAAPDGSAVAAGAVPAGGASLWVPYAGNGLYLVTVKALGPPRGVDRPKALLAEETADLDEGGDRGSKAGPEEGEEATPPAQPADPEPPAEPPAAEPGAPGAGDAPQTVEPPAAEPPAPEAPTDVVQCAPVPSASSGDDADGGPGPGPPAELECGMP
jgi:hypothetical protein